MSFNYVTPSYDMMMITIIITIVMRQQLRIPQQFIGGGRSIPTNWYVPLNLLYTSSAGSTIIL